MAVARNAALSSGFGAAAVGAGVEKKSANGGGDDFGGGGDGLRLLLGKAAGDADDADDDDDDDDTKDDFDGKDVGNGDVSDVKAVSADAAESNERCPLKSEARRGCFSAESLRRKDAEADMGNEDQGDEDGNEVRCMVLIFIERSCSSSSSDSIKITSSSSSS